MDIKDLKTAWDTFSAQEMDKHQLGKDGFHQLLKNRTQTLVDRIDRNIRIGMIILFAFIVYVLVDDFYLSKILIKEPLEYPGWLIPFDVFSDALIVTTYLFFVIRYLKIKRSFSIDLQLKDLLAGILDTIKTYRRMYYLALIIFLLNMLVSYTAGLYQGIKFNAGNAPGGLGNLSTTKILMITGISLAILVPLITLTYLLFRWGFNKLYGQYLKKITDTLQELDESEMAG